MNLVTRESLKPSDRFFKRSCFALFYASSLAIVLGVEGITSFGYFGLLSDVAIYLCFLFAFSANFTFSCNYLSLFILVRIETRFASTDGAIANVFEFFSFYFSVTLLLGLLDLSDYCGG